MRRCRRSPLACGLLAGVAVLAVTGTAAAADADDLVVFGDSYSKLKRKAFPNWAEQLRDGGDVAGLTGFAVSGATATAASPKTFKQQISRFNGSGFSYSGDDLTVLYFGYNDIDSVDSYTGSRAGYNGGLKALIQKGATADGRRMFVVMPHDWGSTPQYVGNPEDRAEFRGKTITWNKYVAGLPRSYANVVAVDLFTFFDKVLADPQAYGLTNVTTADPGRSKTTALYDDPAHFGRRGQELIKQVMQQYLTRASNAANAMQTARSASADRTRDIEAGRSIALASLTDEQQLGLTAYPVGQAPLPEADDDVDGSRTAFDQMYDPDRNDGGVGFEYGLGDGMRVGLVISDYSAGDRQDQGSNISGSAVRSDAVSFLIENRLGAFQMTTRVDYSDEQHRKTDYDEVIGAGRAASFDGRTVSMAERIGRPIELERFTLTPWTELSYATQTVDSFTMSNPYLSDETYSVGTVSDTLAGLGLDLGLAPLSLGGERWLSLSGGVSYTHGLVQDDYRVRVEEAAFGSVQEETIDRPDTRTFAFSLAGDIALGGTLSLGAQLRLDHDLNTGTEETARLGLSYRF